MRLAYCAAKAAVVAMTEVLAIEWADRGIRVNAVAPGVTRTALVQKGIDEGVVDVVRYQARTPMHRFGEPDEIARAVLWLANDEDSSFVTGTTLTVDGGWTAQGWIIALDTLDAIALDIATAGSLVRPERLRRREPQ